MNEIQEKIDKLIVQFEKDLKLVLLATPMDKIFEKVEALHVKLRLDLIEVFDSVHSK